MGRTVSFESAAKDIDDVKKYKRKRKNKNIPGELDKLLQVFIDAVCEEKSLPAGLTWDQLKKIKDIRNYALGPKAKQCYHVFDLWEMQNGNSEASAEDLDYEDPAEESEQVTEKSDQDFPDVVDIDLDSLKCPYY